MIYLKSKREIELMKEAGQVTAQILSAVSKLVAPGIETRELDAEAERLCKQMGAKPAFKGYHDFPCTLCVSVNDEVVHGIPSNRKIKTGDIVSLDFGVIVAGFYGDSAVTVPVGSVDPEIARLLNVTKESLSIGIKNAVIGNRIFDISNSIQNFVEQAGFSVVREFVGHGIGRNLHEEPQVPNFGPKGKGIPLKEGMVIAIEPMINSGDRHVKVLDDGWTAVTVDGSWSAHFEHTVAITAAGPEILTWI